jgi:hypothetical protein
VSEGIAAVAEPRRTRLLRVAEHVRTQNWMAIGIDFLIVVLGVFVGIQVANWNEARQQAERQESYLERLRVDFIGIRDRIREHFIVYDNAVEGGALLLSIVHAEAGALPKVDDERARMERALNALMSNRIPPPLPATYVEMRSEGQVSRISNPLLRDRLAEYDRMLGLLQEVSRMTGDNLNAQAPRLQRQFVSRTVADPAALSGMREELVSYDLSLMRGDPEFAVAVKLLHRNAFNLRYLRRNQLALIEDILALIDTETRP